MSATRILRPSPSYEATVPHHAEQADDDDRVTSVWLDGQPLLLQLSSYLRTTGEQVNAAERLRERIDKSAESWTRWDATLHADSSIDQATAEYADAEGTVWIFTYLVWPHLTLLATVAGVGPMVRDRDNWALQAVRSIRLVTH